MSEAATLMQGADGSAATPPPAGNESQQQTPPSAVTPPPANQAPPTTEAESQEQKANADSGSWYGNIEDEELRGWAENKNFKDPVAALQSMKNMEKLVGSDKIAMPKDSGDTEGWNKVYEKLGRPEKAEDYQLPVPEGADPTFAGDASKWMHEAGLNTDQARALAEHWNKYAGGISEAGELEVKQKSEAEVADLQKEWGGEFSKNVEISDRVNREFGVTRSDIDSILGGSEVTLIKVLKKIGDGMLEHDYKDSAGNRSFTQTQHGAKAEIASLRADKDFMTKYNKGDPAAKLKMDNLYKKATPS